MALITKDTVASLAITGTTSRKIKGKNQPDSKARWSVNATGSLTNDGDTAATEFSQLNVEVVGTLIHPTIRKDTGTYATIEVDQSSIDVLQAIQAKLIEYVGALGAADKIVDYGPANTKVLSAALASLSSNPRFSCMPPLFDPPPFAALSCGNQQAC